MARSQELHDAYLQWLEDLSRDTGSLDDGRAFADDGASIIGTEPGEWWTGDATQPAWIAVRRGFRAMGMLVAPAEPRAYAEGSIGWVIDRPTFRNRAGTVVQTRMTSIFRREQGTWTIIHVHNSLGVPGEQETEARPPAVPSSPDHTG
jgi:hypothetical protein